MCVYFRFIVPITALGWDWGPKYGMGELGLCINQQPWSFYCGKISTYINTHTHNTNKHRFSFYVHYIECCWSFFVFAFNILNPILIYYLHCIQANHRVVNLIQRTITLIRYSKSCTVNLWRRLKQPMSSIWAVMK